VINFGKGKDIDLAASGASLGEASKNELDQQNNRSKGICDRLYRQDGPGVLLADEVGKGKTYVALGVAFAALARRKGAKVLVLTHSRQMANVWRKRWADLQTGMSDDWQARSKDWSCRQYSKLDEFETDAASSSLPSIAFTSYETLKKYTSDERDAGILRAALKFSEVQAGMKLQNVDRNQLIKQILECDLRSVRDEPVSEAQARRINRWLDPDCWGWKNDARSHIEDELDHIQARARLPRTRFDLLIVDEAHKLEGATRHRVIARLLHRRFEKCLLVTATPFALSVEQFRKRLADFAHAIGARPSFAEEVSRLPLDAFRQAVVRREPYPGKEALETKLRRHMVRASWEHDKERETDHWEGQPTAHSLLPTLLLERSIERVLASGKRVHVANRRESLCSSWPAARESLTKSPLALADTRWVRAFNAAVAGREECDPKLRIATEKLVELIKRDTKVVVFTQRIKTSEALANILEKHPEVIRHTAEIEKRTNRFRRHAAMVAQWLELNLDYATCVTKIMARSPDYPKDIVMASVKRWWRHHGKHLGRGSDAGWTLLDGVAGANRSLPLIVRHDANTDKQDRNVEKFNLPSSPLVLIATPKAQEGIDMHLYCHHVVLFDLTWNPAAMEQRIGRVHRIGGNRKKNEKVKVIYCYQAGTYEETIARRVQQRCEMMRVLLGAGQWLDADQEVGLLKEYEMSFPA
jgi:superfamily II DNA or RNA helicase